MKYVRVKIQKSENESNMKNSNFEKYFPILDFHKILMLKNAIKLASFWVRGQFYHQMWLKTGEFSAILSQKPGEFGDRLD